MRRGERGQVLVILAISIFALMGLVALAVDLGYVWSVRNELQRCADAGALAGASRFIPPDVGEWSDPAVQAEAEARARDFASRDNVATSPLKPLPADNEIMVTINAVDPGVDRIRVRTQRVMPLFFARVLGRANQLVFAEAVAEAREVTQNVRCIVPWGIPLPWTSVPPGDPLLFDNNDIVHMPDEGCNDAWPISVYDPATHQVVEPASPRDDYLCQGSMIVLKVGKPSTTQEPGHFLALDFSKIVENCPPEVDVNSGANFYNYMIKHPCECGTKISLENPLPIDLKTGDMVGPTIQAVAPVSEGGDGLPDPSLMEQDKDAVWDYSANMPSSPLPQYSGKNWQNSPRVVKIPVYDPRNPPEPGKSEITPVTFAGFWIQDIYEQPKGQGTVVGRFISLSAFGESGGGTGGGPVLRILRLVK